MFPVLGPGWLGHSLHDEYYGDRDKYNYAMAEIFKNDYRAVIDAIARRDQARILAAGGR